MRFEESIYFDLLPHNKLEFSFGDYYLFENFVIAELHEGIHFDWDKILEVIGALLDYYGEHIKIAYISNRVFSYSLEPQLWLKFQEQFGFIIASATVAYSNFGYINASIEKKFSQISMKRCKKLSEAMDWIKDLKEFRNI